MDPKLTILDPHVTLSVDVPAIDTTLGRGFLAVFAASTLTCTANGVSTAVLPQFVRAELGGSAAAVGFVVGSGSVAAMLLRPLLGAVADRRGRRAVAAGGALLSAVGLLVLVLAGTIAGGTAGRIAFGLGGAAVNTALIAWIVDTAAFAARGRALSLFGVSIWIGLAAGPQLGQAVLDAWGYHAVWLTCVGIELVAIGCVLRAREPRRPARVRTVRAAGAPRAWRAVARAVLLPGVVSAIAWAGEGTVLAFLVLHLEAEGLPKGGLTGAAGVFTLFAVAVVGTRLALGGLPDRIGPTPTAAGGLLFVGAGLGVLAAASSWPAAAAGAVLLGIGFSPMYPSLAMIATARLPVAHRAAGLGLFTAFMDVGIAAGSLTGGLVAARWDEGAALAVMAALQLVAIVLLLVARDRGDGGGGRVEEHARPPA
jgi:MFS family permease